MVRTPSLGKRATLLLYVLGVPEGQSTSAPAAEPPPAQCPQMVSNSCSQSRHTGTESSKEKIRSHDTHENHPILYRSLPVPHLHQATSICIGILGVLQLLTANSPLPLVQAWDRKGRYLPEVSSFSGPRPPKPFFLWDGSSRVPQGSSQVGGAVFQAGLRGLSRTQLWSDFSQTLCSPGTHPRTRVCPGGNLGAAPISFPARVPSLVLLSPGWQSLSGRGCWSVPLSQPDSGLTSPRRSFLAQIPCLRPRATRGQQSTTST